MLGELPALIAAGYADIPEEDIVRLKWWGLYHDKPKVGTFMLRIKLPAGRVTPEQLRAVGELSLEHGNDAGELSTRQTIQLHYLRLAGAARRVRPPRRGRVDDRRCVRRRRAQHHRLPARRRRARRAVRRDPRDRRGDVLLLREPRLQRPAAQAQDHDLGLRAPLQRGGDQLHRARRRDPRGRGGLRRARRRRSLVRPTARSRARRLRAQGRRACRAPRADRRVAGRPPLSRLARQGATQVHGRRHRAGGDAGGGREATRPRASRLHAAAASFGRPRPHGRRAAARRPPDGRRARARRARQRNADARARRARRGCRRRHPCHTPAEPRPDTGSRRTPSVTCTRGSRRSASRPTSTRSAPARSAARASRTATSPSPRRRRGSQA